MSKTLGQERCPALLHALFTYESLRPLARAMHQPVRAEHLGMLRTGTPLAPRALLLAAA